jgi:hypothetical protein
MAIQIIITDAGRAALVAAQHNGTNAVTIAQVGVSGTPIVATSATAALPGEVKRLATISGGAVAADTMHVVIRDESGDVYSTRSFALYLADGTLFASYGQAGVIVEKSAQALMLLAVDVQFIDVAAAMITFGDANFLNPPATTDTAGVVKLASDAEAIAMTNALKALTPRGMALAFTAANVLARLLTVDGAGSGLDADLLDGQDGSYYTNITARLGYTPLNAVNYTAGDILGKLVAVDGAGSGLDADLLDGRQAVEFALLTGAAFTGHVSATTAAFSSTISRAGNMVWDAGNDGAGSGLDADLLDGRQANEFALLSGASYSGPVSVTGTLQATGQVLGNTLNATAGTIYFNNDGSQYLSNASGTFTLSKALNVAGPITRAGNTVWDAANDGAGSGMDADLLDGRQGSEFALLSGATFTGGILQRGNSYIRVEGLGAVAPAAGVGVGGEIYVAAGEINYSAWNATALSTAPTNVLGSLVRLKAGPGNVNTILLADVNGVAITGTLAVSSAISRAGSMVWDASNDGSGSGLDADLLDGRQASEFALLSGATFSGSIGAPNIYSPATAGTFGEAGGANALIVYGTTGAGGGFINRLSLNAGGAERVSITASGVSIAVPLAVSSAITRAGATVWDAANDGSGSGLDADLLDGVHASAFALLTDATRAGSNAYGYWEKRPNGVIEQWGSMNANYSEGQIAITFPIAFTDVNSIQVSAIAINLSANDKYDLTIQRVSKDVNGCVLFAQYTAASSSINLINGVDWRAVGH